MTLPTNITVGDPDHAGIHNAERAAINAKPDDFVDLGDTPSSLAGEEGKTLVVNTAGTALELASPSGVTVKNSIEDDGGDLQLVGDASAPGVSRYYGTDSLGAKGFHELPSGGEGGDVPSPHALGGVHHSADTLANLNSKISDATLDDSSATRTPAEHGNEAHSATFLDTTDVKNSVEVDTGDIQLVGDAVSPAVSNYYGTDGAGVRGFHALPSGGATSKNSIETDDGDLQLVGDAAAPGNNKVYGTDGTGAKGWKDDPSGDGLVAANVQTASYTLVIGDAGKAVEMNVGTANNLTVPPNSSVAFPVGTIIEVAQVGAGQTTIVAGSGVTVRTPGTLVLSGQWSTVSLRKRDTDEWLLAGDVEASP